MEQPTAYGPLGLSAVNNSLSYRQKQSKAAP